MDGLQADQAVYTQGVLYESWTPPILLDRDGQVRVVSPRSGYSDVAPQVVALLSPEAQAILGDLRTYVMPREKTTRHARNEARRRLIAMVNNDLGPDDELDPKITYHQLIEATLSHSGLRVEAVDADAKRTMILSTLSHTDLPAVRLDGIDIIRIY
jgi:hypothetical protein